MYKIAIIGASYLQEPLIEKAKSRGIETHVFAWACGDVGEKSADFFYPISIIEKEKILQKCIEIGIDGICSIASDLASVTVNYVAENMALTGNTMACVAVSTNKHEMRNRFFEKGDPSPKSIQISDIHELDGIELNYPVIVKPVDRSGSRGITKLNSVEGLEKAIENAKEQGFQKLALVEEFVEGREYSVEYISWNGKHTFLSMTQKYTTGAPHFIETGHLEPALVDDKILYQVQKVVSHALDSLEIKFGASHSELKISESGEIKLIEIGGRMGGDNIGANLVELSTGYDFVSAVIDVALGIEPSYKLAAGKRYAAIHFIIDEDDIECLKKLKVEHPEMLVKEDVKEVSSTHRVVDSASRFGYFMMVSKDPQLIEKYMPKQSID